MGVINTLGSENSFFKNKIIICLFSSLKQVHLLVTSNRIFFHASRCIVCRHNITFKFRVHSGSSS